MPFYFAPRSPMMYSIHMGNVPGYDQGCGRILYLVSTVEMVLASGLDLVVSDRNAVLELATFSADAAALDELVDWPLMRQTMWNNTTDEPDRRERRMAEALVHQTLPIDCIVEIAAPTEAIASEVRTMLGKLGIPVRVRPGWYF